MDSSNEAELLGLARTAQDRAKVVRLGAFADDTTHGALDVPDPWGEPDHAYLAMYDQIEEGVAGLVRALQEGTVEQVAAAHRASR
jgi:protein-tyrosine phosphatase